MKPGKVFYGAHPSECGGLPERCAIVAPGAIITDRSSNDQFLVVNVTEHKGKEFAFYARQEGPEREVGHVLVAELVDNESEWAISPSL